MSDWYVIVARTFIDKWLLITSTFFKVCLWIAKHSDHPDSECVDRTSMPKTAFKTIYWQTSSSIAMAVPVCTQYRRITQAL